MFASSATILLPNKEEFPDDSDGASAASFDSAFLPNPKSNDQLSRSFLHIPPFPGAKVRYFARTSGPAADCDAVAAELRQRRVGGSFWGAWPVLPSGYVLAGSARAAEYAERTAAGKPVLVWEQRNGTAIVCGSEVTGECDPWHMIEGASGLVAEKGDELHIIASLLGRKRVEVDPTTLASTLAVDDAAVTLADDLCASAFENPFTGEAMDAIEAIRLCSFWRDLIDANRDIAGGLGFAFWKQNHVAPLLWAGDAPFRFLRNSASVPPGKAIAVWRTKVSPDVLVELDRAGAALIEVEDGFLRSRGLGANCVPPLSITVDRLGAYFDPSKESELERLLQVGGFDEQLLERARDLRHAIVEAGLGKYGRGDGAFERRGGDRLHFLVPGQVEDDRAVTLGGCGLTSNLELLKRVREHAPDAYVLYKPHPDVLAGHRQGAISRDASLQYADEVVGDVPINSLIASVDEVHVNTSLAGFEALLRRKAVITYGMPFYAGWGLTTDRGPVPSRRTARRSIDELVAATLLLYPRYYDPVTGLPCPAEVAVARLCQEGRDNTGVVTGIRRLQGKIMRRFREVAR